jgi:hypothetical protein
MASGVSTLRVQCLATAGRAALLSRRHDAISVGPGAQLVTDKSDYDGTSDPLSGCGRAGDHHLDPPEQIYTCRTDTSLDVANTKNQLRAPHPCGQADPAVRRVLGRDERKGLIEFGPTRRSPVGPALHCSWKFPDDSSISGCES